MIDFASLFRSQRPRLLVAICRQCGAQLVRNLATGEYYRNQVQAEARRGAVRACPSCGMALYRASDAH